MIMPGRRPLRGHGNDFSARCCAETHSNLSRIVATGKKIQITLRILILPATRNCRSAGEVLRV
jgi:hypothetical protein